MSKAYRAKAVEKAVAGWNHSEHAWFSSDAILPSATDALPQSRMGLNVYAVAKALRIMESRGMLESRKVRGVKEYRRIEAEWDGRSHLHA
jgi:hypothetical protein